MLLELVPIFLIMMVVAAFAFLGFSVFVGLTLTRATLDVVCRAIGLARPMFIRWHLVAFGAMLFWSWYFAPTLLHAYW